MKKECLFERAVRAGGMFDFESRRAVWMGIALNTHKNLFSSPVFPRNFHRKIETLKTVHPSGDNVSYSYM